MYNLSGDSPGFLHHPARAQDTFQPNAGCSYHLTSLYLLMVNIGMSAACCQCVACLALISCSAGHRWVTFALGFAFYVNCITHRSGWSMRVRIDSSGKHPLIKRTG